MKSQSSAKATSRGNSHGSNGPVKSTARGNSQGSNAPMSEMRTKTIK